MFSLSAVIPFMIYISMGYLVREFRVASEDFINQLNTFTFKIMFPITMFNNIYSIDRETGFDFPILGAEVVFLLGLIFVLELVIPRIEKDGKKTGVIIQAIYRGNSVLFGIPLAASMFGDEGIAAASMSLTVVVPMFNVAAVLILEKYGSGNTSPKELAISVLKNPILQGSAVGLLFYLLRINVPVMVMNPVKTLGNMSTPLALMTLGGTLHFKALRNNLRYLVPVLGFKMMILPAFAILYALALGFAPVHRFVLFQYIAVPVAAGSFPMAKNMGCDGELAGQMVVMSTAMSVITLFLWVYLLKSVGLV